MKESYQKIIVTCGITLVIIAAVFSVMTLQKLERITVIAELTDAKINKIAEATAPLGNAAIDKGVDVVKKIDSEEMTKAASKGIKDIGTAAKNQLLKKISDK